MKKAIAFTSLLILLGAGCTGSTKAEMQAAEEATEAYCFEVFGQYDQRYDECYEKNYPVFEERAANDE